MMMAMMAMTAPTMMIVSLYNGRSIGLCKHLMLMVLMLARPDFLRDYLDLFDGMTFVDYDGDDYCDNDALTMAVDEYKQYGKEIDGNTSE